MAFHVINTIIVILSAQVIFWFKANSKYTHNLDWNPFQWWLYTSLFTSYMCLWAWWKLVDEGDVWKAQVIFVFCSLFVNLILNTMYYGFHTKGVLALCLCALALLISK